MSENNIIRCKQCRWKGDIMDITCFAPKDVGGVATGKTIWIDAKDVTWIDLSEITVFCPGCGSILVNINHKKEVERAYLTQLKEMRAKAGVVSEFEVRR